MQDYHQVVIWGHKNVFHTHSYVFNGLFVAFDYLKYKVYWTDDDSYSDIDFSKKTIFLTEIRVCKNMPVENKHLYIIHQPFIELFNKQSYSDDELVLKIFAGIDNIILYRPYLNQLIDDTYLVFNQKNKVFFKKTDHFLIIVDLWATDLLPEQIEDNINNIEKIWSSKNKRDVCFVGTMLSITSELQTVCEENGYNFIRRGGWSSKSVNLNDHVEMIKKSYLSPSFQSDWQINLGYIPCRIFKNISYGSQGITNNKLVHDLFDQKTILCENLNELFNIKSDINDQKLLMSKIKNEHTYVNRIKTMFDIIQNQNVHK